MSFNLGLGDVSTIIGICSALGGLGISYVLSKAREEFAVKRELANLANKVVAMDNHLSQTIRHTDLGEAFTRINAVERTLAAQGEAIGSVRESTRRIEGQMQRVSEATMGAEKAAAAAAAAAEATVAALRSLAPQRRRSSGGD